MAISLGKACKLSTTFTNEKRGCNCYCLKYANHFGNVEEDELLAVIGLLYMAGIHKSSHINPTDL